ncbi:MAG TPA: hypothetical protein VNH44_15975, partial [Micropepsaceae bacterium]|nr:hypothetical protein [Micropepsaceae bacterium]
MMKRAFTNASLVALALAVCPASAEEQKSGAKPVVPIFEVDPNFPTMGDHLLLGGVGGATADSHGNVWVFHRPHT